MQALKRQLQPHFLFNTLHTISGLVRNNEKRRAVDMIAGLGDLLRTSIDTADQHEVPLRCELEILERYLEIEQVRFSDRIGTRFHVGEGVAEAAVPNLILQPIVENAIRHGLAEKEEGGTIVIRAARKDGNLEIEVEDDGVGLTPVGSDGRVEGVGLTNARARLRHLYGERGSLSVSSLEGGGTRVSLCIPWRAYEMTDQGVPSAR
ncbi:MAG: sensor histidine kinase [Bacteroidota bacterium]